MWGQRFGKLFMWGQRFGKLFPAKERFNSESFNDFLAGDDSLTIHRIRGNPCNDGRLLGWNAMDPLKERIELFGEPFGELLGEPTLLSQTIARCR